MAGRVANGSVSRFPPAQSRNRRRSREDRGAKTSGDESDHNSRARRNRRREERMRAVMTDTEAVIKNQQNQPHHRYTIFLVPFMRENTTQSLIMIRISTEVGQTYQV